jgi:serine/threonine protein kinase
MADIPIEFELVRDLEEAGQGHTFIVRRRNSADSTEYVLKRLKNPKREEYFKNEVQACSTLEHPNILRLVQSGSTPKGKPFLLTRYCSGGSLEKHPPFTTPLDGLRLFRKIVAAIQYAHAQEHPVYHLDIKPPNVLMEGCEPIVGDFGICFIDDGEVTLTKEGHRGSLHYCAPELRDPKLKDTSRLAAADIYSLGKVLYWLFTHDVYNGHEDDYSTHDHLLFTLNPKEPQFVFIDELVSAVVKKNPSSRIQSAADLMARLNQTIHRMEAQGHILDLRIPQRCLYCVVGNYRPAHDITPMGHIYSADPTFPDVTLRRNPPQGTSVQRRDIFERAKHVAKVLFGVHNNFGTAQPLFLVCDHCGNVQYFRLDYTADKKGLNWLP